MQKMLPNKANHGRSAGTETTGLLDLIDRQNGQTDQPTEIKSDCELIGFSHRKVRGKFRTCL